MRGTWGRLERILERDIGLGRSKNSMPQTWKYVENNIKHLKWFFCRNPKYVIRDLIWWVKHRTTNRYYIIHTDLKPGWWDADTRMLWASFSVFEDYVEKEKPFKIVEWNEDDVSREYANEVHSLYLWWKKRKVMDDSELTTLEAENDAYQKDTENLIRLIKIRAVLWT